jgi:hypothetical protein
MRSDAFRDEVKVDEEGYRNVVIGNWDDRMADVFEGLDDLGCPMSLILPAGSHLLIFTVTISEGLQAVGTDGFAYDPERPLADFLFHVIKHGSGTLYAPGEVPEASHRSRRQLMFAFEHAA